MVQKTITACGAMFLAFLGACNETEPMDMPGPEVGRALYADNCASCHGTDGRGGGPLASGLKPTPSDLTRIASRNKGTFPRAEVMSQIDGYSRKDIAGQIMPEFGAEIEGRMLPFDSGDGLLTPTPEPLVALALYLESLQQ